MEITLTNTGKRYNREWVFRHLDYTFQSGKKYAITGPNGSGKSTLLQIIAGALMHNEGTVEYFSVAANGNMASPGILQLPSMIHHQLAFSAPYLELIEEMTAIELLGFHAVFKPLIKAIPEILEEVSLHKSAHKQIRYYSSGMKQRLKLAQAFFSSTPVLLLDEPLTNLDEDGIGLYHLLISEYAREKLVIISSNDKEEYDFCEEVIAINNFR